MKYETKKEFITKCLELRLFLSFLRSIAAMSWFERWKAKNNENKNKLCECD